MVVSVNKLQESENRGVFCSSLHGGSGRTVVGMFVINRTMLEALRIHPLVPVEKGEDISIISFGAGSWHLYRSSWS